MCTVIAKPNEPFISCWRRFKKMLEKEGVPRDMRERDFYQKQSTIRKLTKVNTKKRIRQNMRRQMLPPTKSRNHRFPYTYDMAQDQINLINNINNSGNNITTESHPQHVSDQSVES